MASSRIQRSEVQKKLDKLTEERKEVKDFITRLETTLKLNKQKRYELEGAIVTLNELLTDKKVKR